MAKLFVRIVGALGVTALALCLLGLVPFLSAGPTAGAGFVPGTPGFTVNREFKGDRLPVHAAFNSSAWQTEFGPQVFGSQARAQAPREIPFGCDASFSPLSSPHLAYVYGRCLS
jgi:hypothetical protein